MGRPKMHLVYCYLSRNLSTKNNVFCFGNVQPGQDLNRSYIYVSNKKKETFENLYIVNFENLYIVNFETFYIVKGTCVLLIPAPATSPVRVLVQPSLC